MSSFPAPEPPYLGPPAHYTKGHNKPIRRIVVHCTVSPCKPGGARDIARYFRSESATGSAHYVVDPGEAVQAAYDDVICWHAPPNPNSLGVELTDPMKGGRLRWQGPRHRRMVARAARLIAELGLAYDVPLRRLSTAEVKAERHGICGHNNVSDAFHESTHWDPGPGFPWRRFMRLVHEHARALRAGADPSMEDDVQLTEKINLPDTYAVVKATGDADPSVEDVLRRLYSWGFDAMVDARVARQLAEARAKAPRPLTEAETEQVVKAAIEGAAITVDVNVHGGTQ